MPGIDEHFFSRKDGYATTFCDLRKHTIFDVVLGRSEAALEAYLSKLPGKDRVRVVCIDLASVYRAIVRKHFPKAKIVAESLSCHSPDQSPLSGLLAGNRPHRKQAPLACCR